MESITQYPTELRDQVTEYSDLSQRFHDAHERASWAEARKLAKQLIEKRDALKKLGVVFTESNLR